ncbi:MAG: macro domain-containing protein [Candidatus Babeliales bacterium]
MAHWIICVAACACYQYIPAHALEQALQKTTETFTALTDSLKKQSTPSNTTTIADLRIPLNGCTIYIQDGNITTIKADAIVNAANQSLMKHPAGVAGAIWNAAGADKINAAIEQGKKSKKIPESLEIGEVVVTDAFDLNAHGVKRILHTPGPNCTSGQDINLLYACYQNCLLKADELMLTSIAFPAMSIGIFGCDRVKCANLVAQALYNTTGRLKHVKDIYLLISTNLNDDNAKPYKYALVQALKQRL